MPEPTSSSSPGALRIKIASDSEIPWSAKTTGFAHISFYNSVLGKLYDVGDDGELEAGLLELPQVEDPGSFVLKIRAGVRFSHGREATADDLEFSLLRFFLTKGRADQVALLRDIAGVEDLSPGMRYRRGLVPGIRRLDYRSVRLQLRGANPLFFHALTDGWISLVPMESLETDYVTWTDVPVGAGRYVVETVDRQNGSVSLRLANPAAAGPRSPSRVEFHSAPSAASIHLFAFQPPGVHEGALTRVVRERPQGFTGLFFNPRSQLGRDVSFRRAIALAVERSEIVGNSTSAAPLYELLTSNFAERSGVVSAWDPKGASRLLESLPSELRAQLHEINVPTPYGRRPLSAFERQALESLRLQLKKVGVTVTYEPAETETFEDDDETTPFRIGIRGTAFRDPMIIFSAFDRGGLLSDFFPGDREELSRYVSAGIQAGNEVARRDSVDRLSSQFHEQVALIPLYENRQEFWIDPARVSSLGRQSGVGLDPSQILASP